MLRHATTREAVVNYVIKELGFPLFKTRCPKGSDTASALANPISRILEIDFVWLRKLEVFSCKAVHSRIDLDYGGGHAMFNERLRGDTYSEPAVGKQ